MYEYRFYSIDLRGHISSPPAVACCPDDLSAIKEAKSQQNGEDIEIWQGPRLVSYLVPDQPRVGKPDIEH